MPTPAQEAFEEGFSALSEVHATAWPFGATSFEGVGSVLKRDDPRLLGSSDRLLELIVSPAELPSPPPTRGDELVQDSNFYRVTSIHLDRVTGQYVLLLVAP